MTSITATSLPEASLLHRYRNAGAYTDCYCTDVSGHVSQAEFITAFYTSIVFRAERLILKWAVQKPSTDRDVAALADGTAKSFAAWNVEEQTDTQLLLCDYLGRTRSWLMTVATEGGTRLYFGSAVVSPKGRTSIPRSFKAMLPFHRAYSVVLLQAAKAGLSGRSHEQ